MRFSRVLVLVLVALSAVLVASVALAGGEGTDQPVKEKKVAVEKTKAEMAEKDVKTEEAKPVMATLTYIPDGGGKGGKSTKQVPYLPEGRKIATMKTTKGIVKLELWEDKAPNTVVNFVSLANGGRYDGVEFHR